MFKSDNSQQLLIGKNIARTAAVNVVDPTNAAYLANGEVVVLDATDTPAAAPVYTTSQYLRFVQRSNSVSTGDFVIQSDRIDGANLIAVSSKAATAAQEQIWSIGFTGTSGSIDESGTDDYVFRLNFKEDKTIWSHYSNARIWRLEPDSTNTQQEVADYFAVQVSDDAFSAAEVKVERLINAADVDDAGITWTFTNGSKTATTSAGTAAVVGDYIKDGDLITNTAYKIVSIVGNTVTLDQKYQGTSAAVVAPDFVLSAVAAVSDFGIKFTGKAQSFTVGKFKYVKVVFDFALSGFGVTTITKSQEALRGNGTPQEVSELEWFSYGFEGAVDRFTDSSPEIKADTDAAATYGTIAIEYFVNFDTQVVSGAKPARKLLLIAMAAGGAGQEAAVKASINSWIATTPKVFAAI